VSNAFESLRLRNEWRPGLPPVPERPYLRDLWQRIPLEDVTNVVEFGTNNGGLAKELLRVLPNNATYRSFDIDPERVKQTLFALATYRGRAFALPIDSSCVLPLPDTSQDLFLSCYVLEHLRMDQLYMLFSEARRTVKIGGHWALACTTFPANYLARLLSKLYWNKLRPLELTHYVSPEDWEIISDEKHRSWNQNTQILLLRRVTG
jgi:ubiquinone/menaquinone biosynthesis C-methylase UbiE